MSYDLATIFRDVPLEFELEDCKYGGINEEEFVKMLNEFEFHSMLRKLEFDSVKVEEEKKEEKELVIKDISEFVSKVQSLRKDADFVITDHIKVYYNGTEAIDKMFDMYKDYVMGEVLGDELIKDTNLVDEYELNDEKAYIKVERV